MNTSSVMSRALLIPSRSITDGPVKVKDVIKRGLISESGFQNSGTSVPRLVSGDPCSKIRQSPAETDWADRHRLR